MSRKGDVGQICPTGGLVLLAVLAVGLMLELAACSGGASVPTAASSASPSATTSVASTAAAAGSPRPVGSQPGSGPDAVASVKADWTAFFDPATPIARRVKLLESGAKFKPYLEVQARPGVAHLTTEHVTSVMLTGTTAIVTYNILVNGTTTGALTNKSGAATYSDGTWQVSDTDFCSLLTIENHGKSLAGC